MTLLSMDLIHFLTSKLFFIVGNSSEEPKCISAFEESLQRYVYESAEKRASHLEGEAGLLMEVFQNYNYLEGETQGRVLLKLLIDEEGRLIKTIYTISDQRSLQRWRDQ